MTTKNNEKIIQRELRALKTMYRPPRKCLGPPQTIWGRYYGCQGGKSAILGDFWPILGLKLTKKLPQKITKIIQRDLCALKTMYNPPKKCLGPPQTIWDRYYGCQGARSAILGDFWPILGLESTKK